MRVKILSTIFMLLMSSGLWAFKHSQSIPSKALKKSALLLIEFQNAWLGKRASLLGLIKDKKQYYSSVKKAKIALKQARKANMMIIHVPLKLDGNYQIFGKKPLWGLKAAISKYKTWSKKNCEFAKGFFPKKGEFIVTGRSGASAFAGSNLDSFLRNNKIERLYIMGYALHVCVESTLRAGHDKGYEMALLSDATAAFTKEQFEHVLKHVIHHFGAAFKVEQFVRFLKKNY